MKTFIALIFLIMGLVGKSQNNNNAVPIYCEDCNESPQSSQQQCKRIGSSWETSWEKGGDDTHASTLSPQPRQQQQKQIQINVVSPSSPYPCYLYPYGQCQAAQYYWAISQYYGPIPDFMGGGCRYYIRK